MPPLDPALALPQNVGTDDSEVGHSGGDRDAGRDLRQHLQRGQRDDPVRHAHARMLCIPLWPVNSSQKYAAPRSKSMNARLNRISHYRQKRQSAAARPLKNIGRLRCAISWQATTSAASSSGDRYCTSSRNIPNATPPSFAASLTAINRSDKSCSRFPVSAFPSAGSTATWISPILDLAYLDFEVTVTQ